jgi:hypothetical protein
MAALVAAITSGSLPLLMAGTMAGHDEIIRRLTLLQERELGRVCDGVKSGRRGWPLFGPCVMPWMVDGSGVRWASWRTRANVPGAVPLHQCDEHAKPGSDLGSGTN